MYYCVYKGTWFVYYGLKMSNVRNKLITKWIQANKPNGLGKLSIATTIPTGSLSQIRAGRVIQDELKRESLARVLGVSVAELFPSPKGKSRAS